MSCRPFYLFYQNGLPSDYQSGSCPDSHYHSFNYGLMCCKVYLSDIAPNVTLGNDTGVEHCSEENTIACPGLPITRCKEEDTSMSGPVAQLAFEMKDFASKTG